jgi:hypothetical protein
VHTDSDMTVSYNSETDSNAFSISHSVQKYDAKSDKIKSVKTVTIPEKCNSKCRSDLEKYYLVN